MKCRLLTDPNDKTKTLNKLSKQRKSFHLKSWKHRLYIQGFSWVKMGLRRSPKKLLACYARTVCVSLSIRVPHSGVLIRQEDTLINSITIDQNRTRVRL